MHPRGYFGCTVCKVTGYGTQRCSKCRTVRKNWSRFKMLFSRGIRICWKFCKPCQTVLKLLCYPCTYVTIIAVNHCSTFDKPSHNLSSISIQVNPWLACSWHTYICRDANYSYFTNRLYISLNVNWFHFVQLGYI